LLPAINLLSTVQVHTTHSAGFTENSNWAAHLLGPALGMSLVSRRHTVFEFIVRNRNMRKIIPEKENKPIGDDVGFIMITY